MYIQACNKDNKAGGLSNPCSSASRYPATLRQLSLTFPASLPVAYRANGLQQEVAGAAGGGGGGCRCMREFKVVPTRFFFCATFFFISVNLSSELPHVLPNKVEHYR